MCRGRNLDRGRNWVRGRGRDWVWGRYRVEVKDWVRCRE